MVVEITPIGIDSIGWRFYIIWTVFNFSFVPIVYFFYPETSGRSLEEIDVIFARGFTNREWYVNVAKTMTKISHAEVEREAAQYGLALDEEKHVGSVQSQ